MKTIYGILLGSFVLTLLTGMSTANAEIMGKLITTIKQHAEILEFEVMPTSKICNQVIKNIDFPRSAIIGGVIRHDEGLIALGDFKIKPFDKIVVCCLPKSIKSVEKLFF